MSPLTYAMECVRRFEIRVGIHSFDFQYVILKFNKVEIIDQRTYKSTSEFH